MNDLNAGLIIAAVVVVLLVGLVVSAVRVVPDYQRMVVFRLGRCIGALGPGIVFLMPVIDRGVRVDLRESVFEVQPQTCITEDNATVSIDFLIYMKVVDAVPSVVQVVDFRAAARGIAITTLRAIVGDMLLDDVLAKRDHINETMRTKLDEATTRWGIKVTAVEIKEVLPPRDILESMTKQMSAERTRRALVLEADGQREAAIKRAEGQKQSAILQAEGSRQATILQAEASRQAAILGAEGYAMALDRVYQVAQGVDSRTLNLQYLETLKALGQSPSTKWIMPLELSNLAQPFTVIAQGLSQMNGAVVNQSPKVEQPAQPLIGPAAAPANTNGNGRQLPQG
jgi:regulator of protease activity HflC (stomatin/prohibitin superfamily)